MNKKDEPTALATVEKEKETKAPLTYTFPPVFVEAEKMFERLADITKETAQKAYEFFLKRGGEFGKEFDDWFHAESKILRPVAMEIMETDGKIKVRAAVPGFKPEEIEISIKDDLLIMSGKTEKREEKDEKDLVYTDWESNQFFRQFRLPSLVDTDNVNAELKDGILTLSLPKIAAQPTKSIAVTAG